MNLPDFKTIEVIRTLRFTPDEYLEHCEDWEEEPTEEGYYDYCLCWKRLKDYFDNSDLYTQEIKVIED